MTYDFFGSKKTFHLLVFIVLLISLSSCDIVYENQMKRSMKKKDYEKALLYCAKLIEVEETPEIYFQYAMLLFKISPLRPVEAGNAFTKAYEIALLEKPINEEVIISSLIGKIQCEVYLKTYDYLEEIDILKNLGSSVNLFVADYYRGLFFFMKNNNTESYKYFDQAYDLLHSNFSDASFNKEIRTFPPNFVPFSLTTYSPYIDIRHWLDETNLFRILILIEQNKLLEAIEIAEESVNTEPKFPYELFLSYFLYNQIQNEVKSNLYYDELNNNYPEYLNTDLFDDKSDINKFFNEIDLIHDAISKIKDANL